jgi:hypothetical protein
VIPARPREDIRAHPRGLRAASATEAADATIAARVLAGCSRSEPRWLSSSPAAATPVKAASRRWSGSTPAPPPRDGRLLVYFTSGYRGGDTQRLLRVAVRDGTGWHAPAPLTGLDSTQNDTFPHVVERAPGAFLIAWTRYDRAQGENAFHPSAETMLSTSSDGLNWTAARVASGPSPTKTDVLPFLYPDHSRTTWSVLWVNEDGVVTIPVDGSFPADLTTLDLPGYSPHVAPTPTPGIDWAVWVEGADPTQQVRYSLFAR